MQRWQHQIRSVGDVIAAIEAGHKRICLAMPTGSGKTIVARDLIESYLGLEKRVTLYSNRKMLVEQTKQVFEKHFDVGVRAAGYEHEGWLPLQIASVQTEQRRLKNPDYRLHDSDLVIVDEAHLNTSASVQDILTRHVEHGAVILGLTATPIDLAAIYDHLIVGATKKECRACGALVPFEVYGPDEPDYTRFKAAIGEDPTAAEARAAIMKANIFGRVLLWFNKLNPERTPTLGFAPGLDESFTFAQEFTKRGIPSAHIDGDVVWWNGEFYRNDKDVRKDVIAAHRLGDLVCIWNRFVLREGVDLPWVQHLILATLIGSTQTFDQTLGRGGRGFPGKTRCVVQDHGGSWWKPGLGDPNDDRAWDLKWTAGMHAGMDDERRRDDPDRQPWRCPECARILKTRSCECGFEIRAQRRTRYVVQMDGTLKPMHGNFFKVRNYDRRPEARAIWKNYYFRFRNTKQTFLQAMGCYAAENNWQWPPRDAPFMPREPADFYLRVKDVPIQRLVPEPAPAAGPQAGQPAAARAAAGRPPAPPAAGRSEERAGVVPNRWGPPPRPSLLPPQRPAPGPARRLGPPSAPGQGPAAG